MGQGGALTFCDLDNLEGLRQALRQNPVFGVGTVPGVPADAELHASMLRLEAAGLVRRARNEPDNLGIWWQAKEFAP